MSNIQSSNFGTFLEKFLNEPSTPIDGWMDGRMDGCGGDCGGDLLIKWSEAVVTGRVVVDTLLFLLFLLFLFFLFFFEEEKRSKVKPPIGFSINFRGGWSCGDVIGSSCLSLPFTSARDSFGILAGFLAAAPDAWVVPSTGIEEWEMTSVGSKFNGDSL